MQKQAYEWALPCIACRKEFDIRLFSNPQFHECFVYFWVVNFLSEMPKMSVFGFPVSRS